MQPMKMDYPALKRSVLEEMAGGGPLTGLREEYVRLVRECDAPFADHILKLSDWLIYEYFCRLVGRLVADRSARIIDWGGQYGQVTALLAGLGFNRVSNYLLHRPPFYERFEEAFNLATLYGQEPNRLEIKSGTVDVFISSGVLEHVGDDGLGQEELILAEVRRVLAPGGLFFIWNLPAFLGTSELLAALARRWRHERRFWRRTVVRLLSQADFEILFLDKHKFLPGSLASRLMGRFGPAAVMAMDDRLSHCPPLSLFGRDWFVLARR